MDYLDQLGNTTGDYFEDYFVNKEEKMEEKNMSMIAKSDGNQTIKRLEDGVYTAISSMLIDLGIQKSDKYGTSSRKFLIVWDILDEFVEVNGEQLPRVMSKEYTMSLGEKSNLRKDLQAWRGKQFTPEELEGFNLYNIINKPCQIQILNTENNGKTYTNIVSIMALPKGMEVKPLDKVVVFDTYDMNTWQDYDAIPRWMKERIKRCENIAENGLDLFIKEYEEQHKEENQNQKTDVNIPKDDLPF